MSFFVSVVFTMHQSFVGTAVLVQQVVELGRSLWGSDSVVRVQVELVENSRLFSLVTQLVQSSVQQFSVSFDKMVHHGVASNENADGQNVSGHSVPRPWVLLAHKLDLDSSGDHTKKRAKN